MSRTALAKSELRGQSQEGEVKGLLGARRITSIQTLLSAYREAGVSLHSAIDGGAGSGSVAKAMLPHLDGVIHAFEPFPGNHRFFADADPRIKLIPCALSDQRRTMGFQVSSVVTEDSPWGSRGMAGYSSVGKLAADEQDADLMVQAVRGADEMPPGEDISVIKLDLQGGELPALQGLSELLPTVAFMWVEFLGSMDLLEYLLAQGFEIFDTEYLFFGEPSEDALIQFNVSERDIPLSTGATAWKGFKRIPWGSFRTEFPEYKRDLSLIQTDLVCVNPRRWREFQLALQALDSQKVGP